MASTLHTEIARLVTGKRWCALASLEGGVPLASMVAYAPEAGLESLLLFLSRLSQHTRNLLEDPRASLAVGEPDLGSGDPQTLPRVSLVGSVTEIPRDDPGFAAAWSRYVARFPEAAPRVELADFLLFRFVFAEARYVGGFARAATVSGAEIRDAARSL